MPMQPQRHPMSVAKRVTMSATKSATMSLLAA